MTDLHFGECPYCDGNIERPFWDTCCFNCQDELREEEAEHRQKDARIWGPERMRHDPE